MFLSVISREAITNVLPGTAIGVALGQPPIQAAFVNLLLAAVVRLTTYLVAKRRARRVAKKAQQDAR